MRRKILSLVLALCMVISLLPMTAFAADPFDVTITVNGVGDDSNKEYGTVNVTYGENVSTPSDGSATISLTEETELTIEVEPPEGDFAVSVKAGENPLTPDETTGNYTYTASSAITITVDYVPTHAVTVETPTNGTIEATVEDLDIANDLGGKVAEGAIITLAVSPNAGYQLVANSLKVECSEANCTDETHKISDLTAGQSGTYTFTMGSFPVKVSANFEAAVATDYTITVNSADHGSVAATVGGNAAAKAKAGEEVTLTVTPEAKYQLKSLVVKDSENGDIALTPAVSSDKTTYTFTMPAKNVTVTPVFEEITYAINVSKSIENGTVTTLPASAAAEGAEVTVTATPDSGYALKDDSVVVTKARDRKSVV